MKFKVALGQGLAAGAGAFWERQRSRFRAAGSRHGRGLGAAWGQLAWGFLVGLTLLSRAFGGVDDLLVRSWQTRDGLPQNTVNALTQTRDGFLWVGTSGGLARFDGVRFRRFGLQDGLRSVRISALLEDSRGVLWVGTTGGGLSQWANGRFVVPRGAEDLAGADVIVLTAEPGGTVWIGTDRGLLKWSEGRLQAIGPAEGLPTTQVRALLLDTNRNLWVSLVPDGLFRGSQGRFAPAPGGPSAPRSIYSLLATRDGSIWAGSDLGNLWQWRDDQWLRRGQTNGLPKSNIEALAQGAEGVIWAGSRSEGLYFLSGESFQRLGNQTGFDVPVASARRLLVDRDGTLWVGTSGEGLLRVTRPEVTPWNVGEGAKQLEVLSVAEASDGAWWAGTLEGGIHRRSGGDFSKLTDPLGPGSRSYVYCVVGTEEGSVWAAGEQFLFRFRAGEPTWSYLQPPVRGEAIRAMCADGANLWLGTYYSTLLKCDGTHVSVVATNGTFGGDIRSIVREGPETLWIGSATGLYRWERGVIKTWNTRDGLLTASVQSLHRDPDGTLWIGTLGGGLARLKHDRIASLTTRQGLAEDIIHQIVADDFGGLWLGGNHGIMRVSRQELEACAEGRLASVSGTVFGENEGMPAEQCVGGHTPTAVKTRAGRLLFPTMRGVVEIDPRPAPSAPTLPPRVVMEEVQVDDQIQSTLTHVVVHPGAHRLEFAYTAPGLRGADWVRFRYRLEPGHADWVNAGTRRTAAYENLRPGEYVFRVAAGDHTGVWNSQSASVAIRVEPSFWQTWWFRAGLGLVLAGTVFAAYRQRITQLERRRLAQERATRGMILSQEQERQRVASELHDGLSQKLALLSVELEMLGQRLPPEPAEINARLKEFSGKTKGLSAEVHRISHGLHPAKLTQLGLVVALRGHCREVETAHGLAVRFAAQEVPRDLPEELALCLYRVAQEAIQNVVKHSGAQQADVKLSVTGETIELAITDDGCGFTVDAQREAGSLGLVSMRERVQLAQGEIAVESAPGQGTRVRVRAPLPGREKA